MSQDDPANDNPPPAEQSDSAVVESFMVAHDDPELMDVEQRADLSMGQRENHRYRSHETKSS